MLQLDLSRWRAIRTLDANEYWQRWERLQGAAPTPFQDVGWLRDWYATLGAQPGLQAVLVRLAVDDEDLLLLPLVSRDRRGLRELLPPDLGVTDYNGPLLNRDAVTGAEAARAMWRVLRPLLARHGDVLRIQKMLPMLGNRSNPLALALDAVPSDLHGHSFSMPQGWEAWRQTLSRQVRREAERHWRVFTRHASAHFAVVSDLDEAHEVLDRLQAMQDLRMAGNPDYHLHEAPYLAFYGERLRRGLAEGQVVLSCLRAEGEVVAAAYGLRRDDRFVMVRTAFDGENWKPCAPGRLLMERTFAEMAARGCRHFDIGVGEGSYKHTFNCTHSSLLELCEAVTPLGRPYVAAWRALRQLRRVLAPAGARAPGHEHARATQPQR